MYTRRKFVQVLSAGAALTFSNLPVLQPLLEGARKLNKIGFIEGIIGKELEGDWKSALRKAAGYGYSEIEIGRYLGETAKSFLGFCKETGIKPVAGGMVFSENMNEVEKSLDELNALELKYAVVYWPWLVGGPFKLEDCRITADMLNRIGEVCNKHGLSLCWHNHDKEFIAMEEGLPFDYLMKQTDKSLVNCELDIYWVQKGGANPVDILKNHRNRIKILHVKDMTGDSRKTFEDAGSGIIDFPSVFSEAVDQGIEHFFVEKDNAADGMLTLRKSAEYLRSLSFA
jgi:sugar phosphate isomerase/epimerase